MTPASASRGTGDAVIVMLHGVGGGKEIWTPQLNAFAGAGYRAVAWDMPGYGETPAIEPYEMAGLARALERVLDAVEASKTVLLGHSMGGMVAQEALTVFPGKVSALILSCTSPAFGKPDGAWQNEFLRQRLAPLDAGETMAELAPRLVADMVGVNPESAGVGLAIEVMSRVPGETYRKALAAIAGFDRRGALGSIRVPVLALAGEHDRTAPPALMKKMAEKIPGADYVLLSGCGHLANVERPTAFNEAVLTWLRKQLPVESFRPSTKDGASGWSNRRGR
jgi:3-oxoadipate enol-lactonase